MSYMVISSKSSESEDAISCNEMKEREMTGVEMGISRLMMMENAGNAIARLVVDTFGTPQRILLVAGTGNNGGDAFVAARHLTFWSNLNITVALIGSESGIHQEEALTNWRILKRIERVKKMEIESDEMIPMFDKAAQESQVIVSAVFGTGFKGKPRPLQTRVIEIINSSGANKVSVDIPSGMDADSGMFETAVLSDYTVTMDSPKIGMFQNEKSRKACGKVVVSNIGVPK